MKDFFDSTSSTQRVVGGGVATVVVVVAVLVLFGPSPPSPTRVQAAVPPVVPGRTTTSTRPHVVSPPVAAPGSYSVPTTPAPKPHGLRNATAAEVTTIAASVKPAPGRSFDSVQIALSDPQWGVLHSPAAGAAPPEYALIARTGSTWSIVEIGYPTLSCYATPDDVRLDLGGLMGGCP